MKGKLTKRKDGKNSIPVKLQKSKLRVYLWLLRLIGIEIQRHPTFKNTRDIGYGQTQNGIVEKRLISLFENIRIRQNQK